MRPGVAGVELNVIGKALLRAHQQAIVMRGAGVLVGAYGKEARIRPRPEVEEAGMGWIGNDWRSIVVPFTEEAEAKLPDLLDLHAHVLCELIRNAQIKYANFRV